MKKHSSSDQKIAKLLRDTDYHRAKKRPKKKITNSKAKKAAKMPGVRFGSQVSRSTPQPLSEYERLLAGKPGSAAKKARKTPLTKRIKAAEARAKKKK